MSMNLQKQRSTLLRAARWIEEHPEKWGTGYFVYRTFDDKVTLCAMGACVPKAMRRDVYVGDADGDNVSDWVNKNFPDYVVNKVTDLNDTSDSPEQAARRIRAFVGRRYS